jgi:hypothetical protein
MTKLGTRRSARWRRRIVAAVAVVALHLGFFAILASDWARHMRPARQDTVVLTLERPDAAEPPRPPVAAKLKTTPAPPDETAASAYAALPAARTSSPTEAMESFVAGGGGPATGDRPGGVLNLGCLSPNLPKRLRDECDRERLLAGLDKPVQQLEGVGPPKPPRRGDMREPGFHRAPAPPGTLGAGVKYVKSPNDKHLLPGFDDTKTTVFEPEEINFLPIPMK